MDPQGYSHYTWCCCIKWIFIMDKLASLDNGGFWESFLSLLVQTTLAIIPWELSAWQKRVGREVRLSLCTGCLAPSKLEKFLVKLVSDYSKNYSFYFNIEKKKKVCLVHLVLNCMLEFDNPMFIFVCSTTNIKTFLTISSKYPFFFP